MEWVWGWGIEGGFNSYSRRTKEVRNSVKNNKYLASCIIWVFSKTFSSKIFMVLVKMMEK